MTIHEVATALKLGAWTYHGASQIDRRLINAGIFVIAGDRMRPHGGIGAMGLAQGHIREAQGMKYEFFIDLTEPATPYQVFMSPPESPDPLRIRATRPATHPDQPPAHWQWFLQLHPRVKEYTEYHTSLSSGLIIQL